MDPLKESSIEEITAMFKSTKSGGKNTFQQLRDGGRIQGIYNRAHGHTHTHTITDLFVYPLKQYHIHIYCQFDLFIDNMHRYDISYQTANCFVRTSSMLDGQ